MHHKKSLKETAGARAAVPASMSREDHLRPVQHDVIAVVGLGYVGLPLALTADKQGYLVIGFDINTELLAAITQHEIPEFLSGDDQTHAKKHKMVLTADASHLAHAGTIIVCVPTPVSNDHVPDLHPLISACESFAPYLSRGTTVIIESTVNPGVCDEIVLPILEGRSGLKVEKDFYFAHCPERINPGDPKWTVRTIPRVLGAAGPESMKHALEIYEEILDVPIYPMTSIKEAEAVKMVENSFRDVNIAFVNELAMSFQKLGIDVMHVIDGASTKPFGFMAHYPGCGVGGHCIPVDPYYLIEYAKQNGFHHRFLATARDINNHMPEYTIELMRKLLTENGQELPGSKIALLGLSYKKDIPDLRESPALEIQKELAEQGVEVVTYDPVVPEKSSAHSLDEALDHASGVILATDHKQFKALTPAQLLKHGVRILIDGRNCLNKELFSRAGIAYSGIGR
jgi:nucleotide sugar dehydrogenase